MSRLKKILAVNTSDVGGGAERIAWTLFKGLQDRGLDSWLVVGDKKLEDSHVIPLHSSPYLDYTPYASASFQRNLRWRKQLDVELGIQDFSHPFSHHLQEITGSEPDVIHLHNLHGGYFDLRAAVNVSHCVPTFVTLEDCWWFSGHCVYPLGCERWQTGCGECPHLHIPPEAKHRDATAANWREKQQLFSKARFYVAAPSDWLLKRARSSILEPAIVDSKVIPHGVDVSVFRKGDRQQARAQLNLSPQAAVVMFAAFSAKSNPFKDYETIRKTVERLGSQGREIELLAVGEAGEDVALGSVRIRHVPFIKSPAEMATYYQAADLYLHAARDEAYGIVVAEAIACGLPVVATDVGGVREVFQDGTEGILVPSGDADAAASAVATLLDDNSLRQQMSAHGAARAQVELDDRLMVDRYKEWYQEALEAESKREETSVQSVIHNLL